MSEPEASTTGLEAPVDRRALLSSVHRVVVKVGTNVLTREDGELGLGRIHTLIEDIVDLKRRGLQVIAVSSGAISMGMRRLGLEKRPSNLPDKQACAAVGQIRLMSVYEQAFERYGFAAAQILLTEDDFASRVRYLNLRNTVNRLLESDVIPIFNENDAVSTSEIETGPPGAEALSKHIFGDNDRLSALVTSKLGAELLILLTDVDGLYPWKDEAPEPATGGKRRQPKRGAERAPASEGEPPRPLSVVRAITPEIEAMCGAGSSRGRGGMISKLQSIKVALEGGGLAVIANGTRPGILQEILDGKDVGTIFLPTRRVPSRKRWIAYAAAPSGRVVVNAGARDALLKRRSSLLFAGVVRIESEFRRGDVVTIVDEDGREFARGIANYGARDAAPLLGKRTSEIERIAGGDYEEFVHRDNIALFESP